MPPPRGHLRAVVLPLGMRFLPLTACALLFALPAKADKFWLSDPAAQQNAPASSSPDLLEGVLLGEEGDSYRIRVVGGELLLAKKAVFKVEKDGLTVEAIAKAEKDAAETLALANRERELQQQIARKERDVKAAEAAARKRDVKPAEASLRAADEPVAFDPVLGGLPAMNRGDLVREMRLAYDQTGNRDYLRALRQLRRLR